MGCKFCFAEFEDVKWEMNLPKGSLPQADTFAVLDALLGAGLRKITFVGGEPTLCPWLPQLIAHAKAHGAATMVVTNGYAILKGWLSNVEGLDWVGLSIDSLSPATNRAAGRKVKSATTAFGEAEYRELVQRVHDAGIRLKINTVVHHYNWTEDLNGFISWAAPQRWKVFQVLPVQGQNDRHFAEMRVSDAEYAHFLHRHAGQPSLVPESNEAMTASYLMIDPAGRFFDNARGAHRYSQPILQVGVQAALSQVEFNYNRFIQRGGEYA
jgi:radical S-adenosyl methionine domain-containing protein 2